MSLGKGLENLKEVGRITHYFSKINVVVVELTESLSAGDKILVRGSTSDFQQTVTSMQIEHENVEKAERGQSIGLKIDQRAREGDIIYKIVE